MGLPKYSERADPGRTLPSRGVRGGRTTGVRVARPDLSPGMGTEGPKAADAAPTRSQAGGRVLVVDDDRPVGRALQCVLRKAGYEAETVHDGRLAWTMVMSKQYDLIISDIAMPGVDGIELLRRVREYELDLPVILMTGAASTDSAIRAVEFGAVAYLDKPLDSEHLIAEIDRGLRLHQMAQLRRQAAEMGAYDQQEPDSERQLRARFDRALDGLFMVYQPIVSWSSRSVFGYEALVRSTEPTLPHPGALFETAERLQTVHSLGQGIRAQSAAPFTRTGSRVSLFVNVHASDLADDSIFDSTAPLASIADQVVLEITERARLEELQLTRRRIERLRAMGFRIAIDDIGAGYAGLSSFALLEPDLIKLDKSLVRDLHLRPLQRKLIRSLTSLCEELGISVVAEGVEQVEERDALVDLGCDLLQGYLFAHPARNPQRLAL